MKPLKSLAFLVALCTAAPWPLKGDNITLANVVININLTEDDTEHLMAANITMQIGNNAAVGGASVVDADKIHFTFPFMMTLDNRFTGANNFQAPITLQDLLDNVLATTNPGLHANGLDGGDVISYAANGGTPIGAFSSDLGNDDDPIENERDSWIVTVQRQIGQNSILFQNYQVNYLVVSPAEGGKPAPEAAPEPASWVLLSAGLIAVCGVKVWGARRRAG